MIRLRASVIAFYNEAAAFMNTAPADPQRGSIAADEQANWHGSRELLSAYSQAQLLIESAAEHAFAVTRLFEEPILSIAPWTCVRASLEAAAYACWLLSDTIGPVERVARSLAFRYEDVRQQLKIAHAAGIQSQVERASSRLDTIERQAMSLGYQIIRDRRDRRIGVAQLFPTATECIGETLDAELIYRIYSAVAHSLPSALIEFAFRAQDRANPTPQTPESTDPVLTQKTLSPEAAKWLLETAAKTIARPLWAKSLLFGYDLDALRGTLDKARQEMGIGKPLF